MRCHPRQWVGHAALLLTLLVFFQTASFAQDNSTDHSTTSAEVSRPITLNGPKDMGELHRFVSAYVDPTRNLRVSQVKRPEFSNRFSSLSTPTPNFGYTKSAIWLRVRVENVTEDISDWRLFFHENFMQQFAVYKISDGGKVDTLIDQNELSLFASRPIGGPELVAPFHLEPNEKATLLVRYESGGSSELSFSIESLASYEAKTSRRTAKNFIYYGMVVLLCVIAIMAWVATRQTAFIAYTFYALSALLFIVHADGNGFKYLWPDFPLFNAFATILLGTFLGLGSTNFARVFLQTKVYHPFLDKALLAAMVAVFGIFVSSLFFDHQQIKHILILVVLTCIVLATLSGFVAALKRFKEVRFYVLAWTGVLLSAGLMAGRHWLGLEISQEAQFDSMRIVLVIDATMMGLAIWDNLNQARKAQHIALKSSLESTERMLKLSTRLHDLEQKYEAASKLAASKGINLINTLHDLRQPLHALRLNVNGLSSLGNTVQDQKTVEQTFDYLEKLVADQFETATSDVEMGDVEMNGALSSGNDDMVERIDFDDILQNIHEMFLPDAEVKGLEFHFVKSSRNTDANALVMMRMISNLVSNSIKYTDKGKILLGVRKLGDSLRVEIHDTGPGMSRSEFDAMKLRNNRLEKDHQEKPGSGHGLAIVEEMAKLHGYEFDMLCERLGGLSLGIRVPIANGRFTRGRTWR